MPKKQRGLEVAKPDIQAEVLATLRTLEDLKRRQVSMQKVVIEWLIHRHGGLRKAAEACGHEPSNFCNMRSGKRVASYEALAEMLNKGTQEEGTADGTLRPR